MVFYFTHDNNVWINYHHNLSLKGTNDISIIITFHRSVWFHPISTRNISNISPDGAKSNKASVRSPGGEPGRGGPINSLGEKTRILKVKLTHLCPDSRSDTSVHPKKVENL